MALIPASIRNNNPGAMYPGPSAKKFGSKTFEILKSKDGTHKIARFDNPIHGAAAQFDLLASKNYTGRTIQQAITKWCGGFYASTYLNVLAQNSGVTANTLLTVDMVRNPEIGIPLARAMALQEAGKSFPMSDEDWQKAHQLAFGVVLETPAVVAEVKAPAPTEAFDPGNLLPSPKPETRVAEMKKLSRKWSLVAFVKRWVVGVPTVFSLGQTVVEKSGLAVPADIPQLQEQLNAVQMVTSSLGQLGLVGWGLILFVALGLLQKLMVEDAVEGRAIPSAGS